MDTNTGSIQSNLNQFTGTEHYHKVGLFNGVVMTDGVQYLAEAAGAYWLTEAIAAYLLDMSQNADEGLTVITITTKDKQAIVKADDGNGTELATLFSGYSDFPLAEAKIWAQFTGDFWVMMLPSEY